MSENKVEVICVFFLTSSPKLPNMSFVIAKKAEIMGHAHKLRSQN